MYGDGRNGWTEEGANVLYQLCLRHNILLEAEYGLKACKVIVHNLVHLRDCVKRFGSLDNYWCYCYEQAVQRYAKTPNNGKNIELTLALCELQREFVQCYKDIDTLPPTEVEDEAHGVAQHMVYQYIYCLTVLVQYVAYERYCYIALGQEVVECS